MDPLQLGQRVARVARSRLSRRAALATSGAGLASALFDRFDLNASVTTAQEATPAAEAATPAALATAGDLPPDVPEWTRTPGGWVSPYGQRAAAEANVVRLSDPQGTPYPLVSFAPLADLHGTLTPNALFYEIAFGGIPDIDPSQHRLMIHGLVERPTLFTMDDLKRFPTVSVTHFMECAGNSFPEWTEATMGQTVQETHGWTSNAEWTGVPLATVMREVGIKPGGTWILAEGADAVSLNRSIPTAKAMADGVLVYAANGEDLYPSQGYPLRLLLPGYEGNMNIKWLRRLKVGQEPWHTRWDARYYSDLMPDGTAREFTFVMEAKSVITSPSGGQKLPGPGFVEITGLAWSGRGRITQVDVSTDGGLSWAAATLQEPVLPMAWTRFRFPWWWDGQATRVQSRAIDETGYVQPTIGQLVEARGVNSFFHNNAVKTWAIAADGGVSNVYA